MAKQENQTAEHQKYHSRMKPESMLAQRGRDIPVLDHETMDLDELILAVVQAGAETDAGMIVGTK